MLYIDKTSLVTMINIKIVLNTKQLLCHVGSSVYPKTHTWFWFPWLLRECYHFFNSTGCQEYKLLKNTAVTNPDCRDVVLHSEIAYSKPRLMQPLNTGCILSTILLWINQDTKIEIRSKNRRIIYS